MEEAKYYQNFPHKSEDRGAHETGDRDQPAPCAVPFRRRAARCARWGGVAFLILSLDFSNCYMAPHNSATTLSPRSNKKLPWLLHPHMHLCLCRSRFLPRTFSFSETVPGMAPGKNFSVALRTTYTKNPCVASSFFLADHYCLSGAILLLSDLHSVLMDKNGYSQYGRFSSLQQ